MTNTDDAPDIIPAPSFAVIRLLEEDGTPRLGDGLPRAVVLRSGAPGRGLDGETVLIDHLGYPVTHSDDDDFGIRIVSIDHIVAVVRRPTAYDRDVAAAAAAVTCVCAFPAPVAPGPRHYIFCPCWRPDAAPAATAAELRHKIDLDELERMAPQSNGCGPGTTLALIARIHELEAALGDLVAECEERTENPDGGDYYAEPRAILEKGAVLPPVVNGEIVAADPTPTKDPQ